MDQTLRRGSRYWALLAASHGHGLRRASHLLGSGIGVHIGPSGAPRAVVGARLYLAVLGLLGLGLGAPIRPLSLWVGLAVFCACAAIALIGTGPLSRDGTRKR